VNSEVYAVEARVSNSHWWFAGRRRLFTRLIRALDPNRSWLVLEVGAGTGANLSVLRNIGARRVVACDLSVDALRLSGSEATLARADATRLPFRSDSIDLLLAADVIEHLDDDREALREFVRVLRPGGHLVLTVPAFPSLWGPQDIVAQHRRRYRRSPLLALIEGAGVRVSTCFHFNYVLFTPIWMARKILLALGVRVASENQINTSLLNRVLTRVFFADVDTAPVLKPPFGVSLCVVAAKPGV
jgi:SAM-dependent methyltransferase